ncbi:hypothetical protein GALMADRAFT_135610 [Galerina marginata CBS 339.88]|uniref:Uncharacterized protein n=1 Tax=Galerina marginata (strain CBS 339.88) TaxID=685588 RepID=A0A067TG97_GALM3|nr:hypothetical protein GALMADRAFT_135610 [Galerina marginata CBS 339.88]
MPTASPSSTIVNVDYAPPPPTTSNGVNREDTQHPATTFTSLNNAKHAHRLHRLRHKLTTSAFAIAVNVDDAALPPPHHHIP